MKIKTKINKWDLIKLKNLYTAEEAINKMKRQPEEQGRRSNSLQRRQTDGQKTYEKMLNITNYQRNANQSCNEV